MSSLKIIGKPEKKKNGFTNLCCMQLHEQRSLYTWEWEFMRYGTIFSIDRAW
ncbi:unnamed protein product [Brassica rapa subsp. trilocularis]